jgi:integrase
MKTIRIRKGSASVKIYPAKRGKHFTVAWYELPDNSRHRAVRSSLKSATEFAEQKADELAQGQFQLTPADCATYLRVREILKPTGVSPELAAASFAAEWSARQSQTGITDRPLPALITDLISTVRQDQGSPPWLKTLQSQLNKFAAHFNCSLISITATQFESWLRGLHVKLITRQNYHAAVLQLVRYARKNRHLAESWNEIPPVDRESNTAEIRILTPEQMTDLLAVAPESLVPFLAICGFAGVRHREIFAPYKTPLDWSCINLEARTIYIPKAISKTDDREVPISDNLHAWLAPRARRNGPICTLRSISNALTKAKRAAGIPAGRDETRNTLRKSYISYRKALIADIARVADEAGNSVAKIKSNYKRTVPQSEAKRWFAIMPSDSGITQLRFENLLANPVTNCDKTEGKRVEKG